MKALNNKSNEDSYFKHFKNKLSHKNDSFGLYNNSKTPILFMDKSKTSFIENSSSKKIPNIKNIFSKHTNNIYQKKFFYNNSKINLRSISMNNKNTNIESLNNKIDNNKNSSKLSVGNKSLLDISSFLNYSKTNTHKNSESKIFNKKQSFNKKSDIINISKIKDLNKNNLGSKYSFPKINKSRNIKNPKLLEESNNKSINNNLTFYKDNKLTNIYIPKKIRPNQSVGNGKFIYNKYNNEKESKLDIFNKKDIGNKNPIRLSKDRLQKIFDKTLESKLDQSLDQKESTKYATIKKFSYNNEKYINKSSVIIPKIIREINSSFDKGHELKNKKDININSIKYQKEKDFNKSNNDNDSEKTLFSIPVTKKFKSMHIKKDKDILKKYNLIKKENLYQKIKFLKTIPKKKKKMNKKHKKFLNKIKEYNEISIIDSIINKKVEYQKKSILIDQKIYLDEIILKENDKLNKYSEIYGKKIEKQYVEEYYNKKIKKNKKLYLRLKKLCITYILLNSYIEHINKYGLDNNLKHYIFANIEFSSLFLPIVKITSKRRAIFVEDKLFSIKNKHTIFQDKKSKFIEEQEEEKTKANIQLIQPVSLNFISKDLNFKDIDSDDDNYMGIDELMPKETPIQKGIGSNYKNANSIKNLRSFLMRSLKKKFTGINRTFYSSDSKIKIEQKNISILEKSQFFEVPGRNSKTNLKSSLFDLMLHKNKRDKKFISRDKKLKDEINKKFINKTIGIINEKNSKNRVSQYFNYDNLLKNITGQENRQIILRTIINRRETLLFIQYFYNNYKRININATDEDGNSFLILSIKQGLNTIIKILLEKGIDVNIQNNKGNSALHYALSGKDFALADLLKKYGAKEDLINKLGYSPWECIGKSIDTIL